MVFWKQTDKPKEKVDKDNEDYHIVPRPTATQNNGDEDTVTHMPTGLKAPIQEGQVLDVVIVGAGWAGISAAATLKKRGIENFCILEAKDHIGGRAYTHHERWEGQDIACDMGAMWIQNAEGNLLNDYIQKYKIPTHPSKFKTRVYLEDNQGPMDDKEFAKLEDELFEKGFYQYQAARQEFTWMRGDEPLAISRDLYLEKLQDNPLHQKLAKVMILDKIELEYSGSLEELSLMEWNNDSWIGGVDSFDHFVLSGYSSLVYAYAKDEGVLDKVIQKAPVATIDTSDNGSSSSSNLVRLTYQDGEEGNVTSIQAKRVIVTVPLGVLQANAIEFIPPLPKSTNNAIQRLGMGKMNKIFMFWKSEDVFWPQPSSSFEVLGDVTDRKSTFLFYNSLSFQQERPVLYAFFKDDQVLELETQYANDNPKLYEQKISELAMECLQSMFGKDIPQPEKVVVTSWIADEYSRGAYSFNKVGMKPRDREILTFPIAEDRIHFAGEAVHERYFGTTTGAFLTGRAAAKKVAKALN